jgi:hypothetical protein
MASKSSWGRLKLWYDKQPLWLTDRFFERVGLTLLGTLALASIGAACWLVVFVSRHADEFLALTDLGPRQ